MKRFLSKKRLFIIACCLILIFLLSMFFYYFFNHSANKEKNELSDDEEISTQDKFFTFNGQVILVKESATGGLILSVKINTEKQKGIYELLVDESVQITKDDKQASLDDIKANMFITFDAEYIVETNPPIIDDCKWIQINNQDDSAQDDFKTISGQVIKIQDYVIDGSIFYQVETDTEEQTNSFCVLLDESTLVIQDDRQVALDQIEEGAKITFDAPTIIDELYPPIVPDCSWVRIEE